MNFRNVVLSLASCALGCQTASQPGSPQASSPVSPSPGPAPAVSQVLSAYTPPGDSLPALAGVNFTGEAVGRNFRTAFSACDTNDTCEGKPLKRGCSKDPNHNSVLLRLRDNTIFYDAKMGLDADGSPYSKNTPGQTDQPETSLRYPLTGKPSVNSDRVPFIVIPMGAFAKDLGLAVGDVAAVVYGGRRVYAIVADRGPQCKIGEGSIQLHEMLGHKVCKERADNGDCTKLRDAGIERNVLYFVFPGSGAEIAQGLTPENINARLERTGEKLWARLVSN
jgi:Fungal chitosanase of glycosyl hydrolase group 75